MPRRPPIWTCPACHARDLGTEGDGEDDLELPPLGWEEVSREARRALCPACRRAQDGDEDAAGDGDLLDWI